MNLITRNNSLIDRVFDDFFDIDLPATFNPSANVIETKDGYELQVNLPGIDKKDINIELKNDILTISGERKKEHKEDNDKYYHYEVSYGRFSRSWHVDGLKTENVKADFKNGVLKISILKKEETKPKKIELK